MTQAALSGEGLSAAPFPIGNPGQPWGETERAAWLTSRDVKRSYKEEVLAKLEALSADEFEVAKYGSLSIEPDRYPLYYVKARNWVEGRPCVLVTGGVHGYETSGVHGAIMFINESMKAYRYPISVPGRCCLSPGSSPALSSASPLRDLGRHAA
jgi:hypothetical protein